MSPESDDHNVDDDEEDAFESLLKSKTEWTVDLYCSNTKLLFLWTEYISFVPPGAFVSFILILGQIDEGKLRRKIYCTNRKGKIYQRKLHLKF